MTCVHLQKLYQLCHEEGIKLSGSDLIHLVCHQCDKQEVCPSTLTDEYDARTTSNDPPSETECVQD